MLHVLNNNQIRVEKLYLRIINKNAGWEDLMWQRQKESVYAQIKFKSWKSWLIWTICAIFSTLWAITKEVAAIENYKIAGRQKR